MDLHQAILKADFLQVRRLVESGADVNSRDGDRRTPLMLCCLHDGQSWALGAARMLLVHGGRVGWRDARGRSALVYAVLYERPGLVKLFLQALDYDPGRADGRGRTALWYAVRLGNAPIRDLLVQTMERYGLKTDVEPDAASGLGGQGASGRGRGRSGAVERQTHDGTTNRKSTGLQNLQPGRDVTPLFRKNLPYKPLPEHLWEKRASFYKALKPRETKPELKKVGVSTKGEEGKMRGGERGREQGGKEEEGKKVREDEQKTTSATPQDWKLDLTTLSQALQHQISPSYRSRAQPRPPAPRPRRRTPRLGPSPTLESLLRQRRQRGRKMSLDAISDGLRKERSAGGAFRRRCSVAVIPMIRMGVLGGRRDSATGLEGRGEGGGGGGGGREGSVTPKRLVEIQEGMKKNLK